LWHYCPLQTQIIVSQLLDLLWHYCPFILPVQIIISQLLSSKRQRAMSEAVFLVLSTILSYISKDTVGRKKFFIFCDTDPQIALENESFLRNSIKRDINYI
jgi:hypothetical protein